MQQNHSETYADAHAGQNHQYSQAMQVFVPHSEQLLSEIDAAGGPIGQLVPFSQDYQCIRLLDGTYEFSPIKAQ